MATVNKQSLREKFDALKAQFERLCATGKIAADSRALFQAMLMLFEVLMAVFMEKRTPKNSTNSSKPPSQTPKDDTATHPGANSKGNAHNDTRCANTRTMETVRTAPVTQCETCGEDLSRTPCQGAKKDPPAAKLLVRRIYRAVSLLKDNPSPGPPGRLPGTREPIIPKTRYVVTYRVRPRLHRIEILRVFHASRRLPEHW